MLIANYAGQRWAAVVVSVGRIGWHNTAGWEDKLVAYLPGPCWRLPCIGKLAIASDLILYRPHNETGALAMPAIFRRINSIHHHHAREMAVSGRCALIHPPSSRPLRHATPGDELKTKLRMREHTCSMP